MLFKPFKRQYRQLLPFYGIAIFATWWVSDHIFFWDTIQLGSKQAHWYFENQFNHFILPNEIDSGHLPTFGMYLAALWMFLGKSLWISHFALLPFTLMTIWLVHQIGTHFLGSQKGVYLLLLLFVEPTFAAQSVLVSPDVVLFSFFVLGLYAILKTSSNILLLTATLGLVLISLRGMMVVALLFFIQAFATNKKKETINFVKSGLIFIPSVLIAITFLIYHYSQTGWIGYHEYSPWAASFERVNTMGFLKNIILLCWRFLDFGRVFIVFTIFFVLAYVVKNKSSLSELTTLRKLIIINLLALFILCPTLLIYKGLLGHRYLLPIYFLQLLLCSYLIFNHTAKNQVKWLYTLVFTGLLMGNLWIYPKKIAQGWDSTLAHLPYYELREKMMNYIQEQSILLENIGTRFPEIGMLKYKDLSEIESGMINADLKNSKYIFYTTIMNDFTDNEIDMLEKEWKIKKIFKKNRIEVILYERK
jgi:hypothetical protein